MKPDSPSIHIVPLEDTACDTSILSHDELARADSFHFDADRHRWHASRVALKQILAQALGIAASEVTLSTNPYGKPLLAPPFDALHFNLSHCKDLALITISTESPVGVDIEPLDRAAELLDCESSFCHPQEITSLPQGETRALALLNLWTAKEALLKAIGTGLSTAPETILLQVADDASLRAEIPSIPTSTAMSITRLNHPVLIHHCAALCSIRSAHAKEPRFFIHPS